MVISSAGLRLEVTEVAPTGKSAQCGSPACMASCLRLRGRLGTNLARGRGMGVAVGESDFLARAGAVGLRVSSTAAATLVY